MCIVRIGSTFPILDLSFDMYPSPSTIPETIRAITLQCAHYEKKVQHSEEEDERDSDSGAKRRPVTERCAFIRIGFGTSSPDERQDRYDEENHGP